MSGQNSRGCRSCTLDRSRNSSTNLGQGDGHSFSQCDESSAGQELDYPNMSKRYSRLFVGDLCRVAEYRRTQQADREQVEQQRLAEIWRDRDQTGAWNFSMDGEDKVKDSC